MMSLHPVTVHLPENVYKRIRRAAEITRRTVDEVIVEAVSAVAPDLTPSPALRNDLAQMTYLNDAALWQAARATMPADQRARMEELHTRQKESKLKKVEQVEEQALLQLYRETVLVRAQAAVLLKQRGYDVSDLPQFQPLYQDNF
jgi:hypothetical protein